MDEKELFEIIKEAARDGRTELDLSGKGIEKLPAEIEQLTKVTSLNLRSNKLTSLPTEIGKLKKLRKLNLCGNKLVSPPDEINELTNLKVLDLGENRISLLSRGMGRLTRLMELYLNDNQLASLPKQLGRAKKLRILRLEGNQLNSLPVELGELENLKTLGVSANRLRSVPRELGKLKKLETLSLQNNRLKSLPVELGLLDELEYLYLEGNSLRSPPPEVITRGTEAIKDYLRQIDKVGKDNLYEAKMLIVGEAGAGKTTLAKKIEDENYELQTDESSTKGIDVIKWHFAMERGRFFRVNIWDFGGQEIYHATHQFFLTKRSLYALVADARKEDTDFYYWLNVVELLSDKSPLLVIKNEKQNRHREINENALRGQFSNLKEILPTNLATNRGLEEIKEKIKSYIAKLPHVGAKLPKTWVKVRDALEKDERNYIGIEEYLKICERNGFRLEKDKMQLSGYLHDLGVCLHFQDDLLLKRTVILKPEWGTNAVYKVLDNEGVIRNRGVFTQGDVKRIWDEPRYRNMHAELLQLMINFKLCYKMGDSNEYIAPQLLTKNEPSYDWDEENNLILRYTYEFMPKGIVTQFIVAMHPLISDQRLVWREGVVLEKDETKAEVIENYEKREIRIRVVGKNRKELMTIVTYALDRIHRTYKHLKHSKWIPCNCDTCKGSQKPHFYAYDKVREFIRDRQYDIQCQKKPYRMVNALMLIGNVVDIQQARILDKDSAKDELFEAVEKRGLHLYVDARSFQKIHQEQEVWQEQKTEINIEIRNEIQELANTLGNMKEDILDGIEDEVEREKLAKEMQKVEDAIEEVGQMGRKEEVRSSRAMDRVRRFIDKLDDVSTRAGKAIRSIENGIGYAQDLAKNYNRIAQWFGLPVVPDVFLKKEK